MKTIINNLKKYMLISFVFISAGTMAADNGRSPLATELNNIELPSVFVDILAGDPNETALEMEGWMYDAAYWNYPWIAEADESEVVIEGWMVDASYWNYPWIAEADESEVVIEEWMVDPDHWRFGRSHDCARLNETAIPEKKMPINDWMKDTSRWIAGS